MPRKRQKRGREGGGGDGDGGDRSGRDGRGGSSTPPAAAASPAPAQKRLCLPLPTELEIVNGCRSCSCSSSHHNQGLPAGCACVQAVQRRLEAAASRFMEEVKQILTSPCNLPPCPRERTEQKQLPSYKLIFVNSMGDKIFTTRKVRAAGGGPLKIKMVAINQQGSSSNPQLLSANIKVVVLHGDFNPNNCESWTLEEFENNVVLPREKTGVVLTGKLELQLKNGEANLENIKFVDISKFTRSGKFRLGVKLIDNLGERVQEGITEPFTVNDRRGEGNKKCKIPKLDFEIWRLEKIGRNGRFFMALKQNGITLVKHFLRQYHKDKDALRNILSNASDTLWRKMVDHALKCDPGSALYSYVVDNKNIRIYFTSLGQIVGVTTADQYIAFNDLDERQKEQVEKWSKGAYECLTYSQPDFEMYDLQPRIIDRSTFQGSITPGPVSTEPTDQIIHEVDEQDTSEGNNFSDVHSQHRTIQRLHSRRGRALASAQENNKNDASFDIDARLDLDHEIHHETPDANAITGLVITQPTTTENGIIGPVPLDQGSLAMNEGSYQMPSTKDDSPVICSFSESDLHEILMILEQDSHFSAENLSKLSADVRCFLVKLFSCRRWIKLTAPVKLMAIMASSRKIRASKGKALA